MPLIFFFNTDQQVVARGERLGWCNKILLWFGFPVDVRAAHSDDIYTITKHHPPILQIADSEAERRVEAARKRAEEEHKRNPNPGAKPRLYVPGGR